MSLTLRQRIFLTLVPLLLLLAILGSAGAVLLYRLGSSIDAILRENYDSVIAMEGLNEALERIDSSFQFSLAGEADKAQQQYAENWKHYDENLDIERHNITIEGEAELVAQLEALTVRYRKQGDTFYRELTVAQWTSLFAAARQGPLPVLPFLSSRLPQDFYFMPSGLLETFDQIKDVSGKILRLNEDHMKQASETARRTARASLVGFGLGLGVAVVLAGLLAWRTARGILRPIQLATQSALAIGAGDLDQIVPVRSHDELGQLAEAFNTMARQLRHYRQTNYEKLLRAQRTSQATIDSFPDPVLVINSEGQVEMANPAARFLLGASPPGTAQSAPLPWQPPEPLRAPLSLALTSQQPFLPEGFDRAISLRIDGREHIFLPRILPIRDPYENTLGAALLLQDVTRFRLLDQVKTDLVATVSHELKTPLTSIRLALHLLLEETVGPLQPKQLELLLDARDNAERLLAMIDHLLDLARMERGPEQLNLVPESPAVLLRCAADAAAPRAQDKGVTLAVEVPPDLPPVRADPQRLGHALANLLDNAVTYTDRGGRIALSATAADGSVIVSVADTGRGIPAEYLPHVFDKFFRVPGQNETIGTGLGLAITREIVVAHGGTIMCESQPGSGTVFRITLPALSADGGRPSR